MTNVCVAPSFLVLSCSKCKLLMNTSSRTNYKELSENGQSYRSSSRNLETACYKTLLASDSNLYLQTGLTCLNYWVILWEVRWYDTL